MKKNNEKRKSKDKIVRKSNTLWIGVYDFKAIVCCYNLQ